MSRLFMYILPLSSLRVRDRHNKWVSRGLCSTKWTFVTLCVLSTDAFYVMMMICT